MKESKFLSRFWPLSAKKAVSYGLLLIALLYGGRYVVGLVKYYQDPNRTPADLTLRHNESLCAHTRVNPYHVWNGDVVSQKFQAFDGPESECPSSPKMKVHCYPPWHIVLTWFYGSLPLTAVIEYFYTLTGVALLTLLMAFVLGVRKESKLLCGAIILFETILGATRCYFIGNYGILLAALLLLLIFLLKKDRWFFAGVVWSLILVKPQVGALLCVPLLIQKKYKTVVVTAAICLGSTFLLANHYGESALDLLLQVPKIGAKYNLGVDFVSAFFTGSIRAYAMPVWSLVCLGLCVWHSWRLRDSESYSLKFAPAAFFFMYWTYCNGGDKAFGWPYLILMASAFEFALDNRMGATIRSVGIATLVYLGISVVSVGLANALFGAQTNPTGIAKWVSICSNFVEFAIGNVVLYSAAKIRYGGYCLNSRCGGE